MSSPEENQTAGYFSSSLTHPTLCLLVFKDKHYMYKPVIPSGTLHSARMDSGMSDICASVPNLAQNIASVKTNIFNDIYPQIYCVVT